MAQATTVSITRPRASTFLEKHWRHFAEVAFVVPAYFAYSLVRGLVDGQGGTAYENAMRVIHIERQLGIFHEAFLQQAILQTEWLVRLFNYYYVWSHLPVILVFAIWLYMAHRHNYALYRNAFLISGLIALIGFMLMPLMPPRYMPEFGFTDTVAGTQAYYALQNPKIVNQYAAMPSMHFAWDLLVAIAIFTNARTWSVRWLAFVLPLLMLSGIVLTANHFFLDAVGGAVVALVGLTIALGLRKCIRRDSKASFLT
jgi:hypothetical protein